MTECATYVKDPLPWSSQSMARVVACRSCGAPVYWSVTKADKPCLFDVVDGQATELSHFGSCPQAKQWTRKKRVG